MAEFLKKLRELQSLPPELHWFCDLVPSERVKSEYAIGESLALRKEHVCACLNLFAFNGDDASRYKEELAEAINTQLSRCDRCIVGYYKSRKQLVERLWSEHEEDEVVEFIKVFDARDIDRIKQGLDKTTEILRKAEPPDRSRKILDLPLQLTLFEALSFDRFLADEASLRDHFQEPFNLIQTNRRLKITDYVPAATAFLFDGDRDRSAWAAFVWSKYGMVPSEEDFNFAVRDALFTNMQRNFEAVPDKESLQRLWHGIGLIVSKLDNSLVTHSLRAMDIDVFRLALEHLKYDTEGLRSLVQTIKRLLEIAPKDFWDSMGAISPTTFIEQIFNNPQYDRFVENAKQGQNDDSSELADMLSWIRPFMASLETVHQARACRSLSFQLLNRLQADRFPLHARLQCKRVGLATLAWTLNNCNKEGTTLGHTGRVVAAETLEVTSEHIKDIITTTTLPTDNEAQIDCSEKCLKIIKAALALECKSLRTDQDALKQNKEVPDGYASYSPAIWDAVVQHLDRGNVTIARAALIGINDLTGLEKFKVNVDDLGTKEKSGFNVKLGRLTHLVCQILERINDFNPTDLDKLFRHSETATALVAALFSPDANLYEAGVNLIKSISSESARKEAIGHLLQIFLDTTLNAFSWAIRRIARNKTFAACPRMLKTSNDIVDILCDSQNGLLRTRTLSGLAEVKAVENFWEFQWEGLRVIYEMTEQWGKAKVAEANALKEFCRDTMQFSQRFFDQYSVFANAIGSAAPVKQEDTPSIAPQSTIGKELLKHPAKIMENMVKWLRLRDTWLIEFSVKLTIGVLDRLTDLEMKLAETPCGFLEQILNKKPQARSNLRPQEKAELARALEANLNRSVSPTDTEQEAPGFPPNRNRGLSGTIKKKSKAGTIDLDSWRSRAKSSEQVIEVSDDEFGDSELLDQDLLSVSRSADLMKEMQAITAGRARQIQVSDKKQAQAREFKATKPGTREYVNAKAAARANIQSETERTSFREKREKEREAKKKRDAETLALVKKKAGLSGQTLGEGSGLGGLGVKGKDHAPKVQSMMVSSGSESESDDELDRELFGGDPKIAKVPKEDRFYKPSQALQAQQVQSRGPIKKNRQQRSAKDMRARLAPDLTMLHKTILGWNFFHNGDFPPGSDRDDYSLVTNTFRTPVDYQNTFEPLLVLEAWQGFLKSKEEGSFKPFEIKIANRMNVDAFLEISTTIPMAEGKELGIGEADIVLMSKGQNPSMEAQQPNCLARVWKINRKKATMEITYRANVGNGLVAFMVPNATLYAVKVLSITPLEREYASLSGLKYFDLCDEIVKAKPSPLLEYSEKQLTPLMANYSINTAQAKAIKSAVDNDAFTLIQGPPGSGKTKTIVAIVGALLTNSFVDKGVPIAQPQLSNGQRTGNGIAAKKLLVCAPSNAAVDELVMRFKDGVRTTDGNPQKLSVIRLGRSDAINANVLDVTLEELVNAKLNLASGKKSGGDDIHKIMMAHKATSEELNALRARVDELKASGKPMLSDQDRQFELLKRKKQQLSNQIDATRDSGDVVARDAELSRRRVQQEILDSAHVICATLSGSGHEMFQNLNIEFETVIIDEAAQSIELSALIPLKYGCSKCILVGDPKQLPPTVLSREAARFQYEQSLFVRMQGNHPHDVHLLDTQYRMHPEISVFPSNVFYEGRLLDGTGMARLRARPWHQSRLLGPYRFFDVQGQHQSAPRGHSLINLAEIDIALKLFDRLVTDCKGFDFRGKVGIITPYKSQLRELRSRFAQRYGDSIFTTIEFNTTDAFQGRESDIIIFSCVRASLSKGIGFLSDIRRMNVGITRAKCSLWVLGNSQSLMQGEFWNRMIQDAKFRDRYTTGDLNDLLKKPLFNNESAMSLNASAESYPSEDLDIEMPDAPNFGDPTSPSSMLAETSRDKSASGEADMMTYLPAGGASGFNSNSNCQKCGSFSHYTAACDNADAKAQVGLKCFRCNAEGHTKAFCNVERCFTCGGFGHRQKTCSSTEVLSNNDKIKLGRQEAQHNILLQQAPEMHRKRQLGDHDRQVPIIRSTSITPPPSNNRIPEQNFKTGEKRRRGSSPPVHAPKGPKITKDTREVDRKSSEKWPVGTNQPLTKLSNGIPSRDRSYMPHPKLGSTTLPPERLDSPTAIANARTAGRHDETLRKGTSRGLDSTHPDELLSAFNAQQKSIRDGRSWDHPGLRADITPRQRDRVGSGQNDGFRPRQDVKSGRTEGHKHSERDGARSESGGKNIGTNEAGPRRMQAPIPNPVRMPKRKKEVDPFIRPKKRP